MNLDAVLKYLNLNYYQYTMMYKYKFCEYLNIHPNCLFLFRINYYIALYYIILLYYFIYRLTSKLHIQNLDLQNSNIRKSKQ